METIYRPYNTSYDNAPGTPKHPNTYNNKEDKAKPTPPFRHPIGDDGTTNKSHHDAAPGNDSRTHFLHHELRGHILPEVAVPKALRTIIDPVGPGSRVNLEKGSHSETEDGAKATKCIDHNHLEAVDVTKDIAVKHLGTIKI